MERTVPHPVPRTVRRITVTSLREPVWVVYLDTKVPSVKKVSIDIDIKRNINLSAYEEISRIRT